MTVDRSRLLFVGGLLLVVIGAVWSLQGQGLLGGSSMTDDRRWLAIGAVTIILGALMAYRGTRADR
ncbi:MAG: hypothetical protein R3C39_10730 [Dehalococcoidia bacterium]